MFISS